MGVGLFTINADLNLDASDFKSQADDVIKQARQLSETLSDVLPSDPQMVEVDMESGFDWVEVDALLNVLSRIGDFAMDVGGIAFDLAEIAANEQAAAAAFSATFFDNATQQDYADQAMDIIMAISEANSIYYKRLRDTGTGFYAQFKASGMDAETALGHMDMALRLAADAAAFYDISLEDASERIRSFLRGNVEAGEAIGLFANDASRSAKVLELFTDETGECTVEWKGLTEAQKEYVLLSIAEDIYTQNNAIGQASREAEAYANQLGNLKAIWNDVVATLGGPILEAIIPAIQTLSEFLQNNPQVVENIATSIGMLAETISDVFIGLMNFLAEHPEILDQITSKLITMVANLVGITPEGFGTGIYLGGGESMLVPEDADVADYIVGGAAAVGRAYLNSLFTVGGDNPYGVTDAMVDVTTAAFGLTLPIFPALNAARRIFGLWGGDGGDEGQEAMGIPDLANLFADMYIMGYQVGSEEEQRNFAMIEAQLQELAGIKYVDDLMTKLDEYKDSAPEGTDFSQESTVDLPESWVTPDAEGKYSIPGETLNEALRNLTGALKDLPGQISAAMAGLTIQMDGKTVGTLVAPTVSAYIKRNATVGRNTTPRTTSA